MSLREGYRQDPPEMHWKNPYLDDEGSEFCGHCGDDWPHTWVRDRPRRGDAVEAWLRRRRDELLRGQLAWLVIDALADDYRRHAKTDTPLDADVPMAELRVPGEGD